MDGAKPTTAPSGDFVLPVAEMERQPESPDPVIKLYAFKLFLSNKKVGTTIGTDRVYIIQEQALSWEWSPTRPDEAPHLSADHSRIEGSLTLPTGTWSRFETQELSPGWTRGNPT
jgi:hypothetical protein